MPTYVGFDTVDRSGRDSRSIDRELVKADLRNAFAIRRGEVVGSPLTGSVIWLLVGRPFDQETRDDIETEVRRVVSGDPRVEVLEVRVSTTSRTMEVAVDLSFVELGSRDTLAFSFPTA